MRNKTKNVFGCLIIVLIIGLGLPLIIVPSFRVRFANRVLGIKPGLRQLTKIYNDKDAIDSDKEWAARQLARLKDPKAIPQLLSIIRSYDDDNIRRIAAGSLASMHNKETVSGLMEMIRDGYGSDARYNVQRNIFASWVLIDLHAVEVVSPLIKSAESISGNDFLYLVSEPWVLQQITDSLSFSKDSSVRAGAAQVLAKKGDEFCIKNLISAIGLETNILVREAILKSLCNFKYDSRISQILIEEFRSDGLESIRIITAQCIDLKNNPSVHEIFLRTLLHDKSSLVRVTIVKALSSIRNARTDSVVANAFRDVEYKESSIVWALDSYGISPRSDRQKVYWWITLHNSSLLQSNWEITKRVLISDIISGNREAAEYAMETFIALGREEIVNPLISALNRHGTKAIAEVYLNCGHELLEQAAEDWAWNHGYYVVRSPGGGKVRWGSMR